MKDFIDYSLMWLEMATQEQNKKKFIRSVGDMGHDYFADFNYTVKSKIAPNLTTMMYMQIQSIAYLNYDNEMRYSDYIKRFIALFSDYKDSDDKLPDMWRQFPNRIRCSLLQIWYILDIQKINEIENGLKV